MTGANDLRIRIGEKAPGVTIGLTLLRDGKEETVTATLQALQPEKAETSPAAEKNSAFLPA